MLFSAPMGPESVYAKNPDFIQRNVAGECILVPIHRRLPDRNSIYVLNETGAEVWNRLDGRVPLRAVIDDVHGLYDVAREQLHRDVVTLMTDLLSIQAIEEVSVAHGPTG
ncbi:hypothetical protein YTPLAS18_16810 [Nitrospira sp.]|nr:hypothetical protein YTPLAS18_16810 [Nitrospira sp.]